VICNFFVESFLVSIGREIKLERLRFEATFSRQIFDRDFREVRLAGNWAERGKVRRLKSDPEGPASGVGERLQDFGRRLRRKTLFAAPEKSKRFAVFFLRHCGTYDSLARHQSECSVRCPQRRSWRCSGGASSFPLRTAHATTVSLDAVPWD